jgi:hypothetical protein
MAGINRDTGQALDGWEHVVQSLRVLFTTPRFQRVMRRHVGSDLARLVDQPVSPVTVIKFYAAVGKATRDFEPRYRITKMRLSEASDVAKGAVTMDIEGVYFPRGHLGDFSISEPRTVNVPL